MSDMKKVKSIGSEKNVKLLILSVALIVLVFFLFRHRHLISNFNITEVKSSIQSYGNMSIVIFLLISALKPVILILPTAILSIASGSIYGPVLGFVISLTGSFLSATTAFFISRIMGKGIADKLLKGKAVKLDNNIEKHGFKIMLFMRLGVIFPFDALSYAAGLSKMKYRDFAFGTVLGIIPEMISYSYAGENLDNPFSLKFIAPIILIVVLAAIFSTIYKKIRKDT